METATRDYTGYLAYYLRASACGGHLDRVKAIIENGKDITSGDIYSAIISGVSYDEYSVVEYLLPLIIDENVWDIDRLFESATSRSCLDMLQLFERYGFDLHRHNEKAMRTAFLRGRMPVAIYLIEDGADIHVLDDEIIKECSTSINIDFVNRMVPYLLSVDVFDKEVLELVSENLMCNGFFEMYDYIKEIMMCRADYIQI